MARYSIDPPNGHAYGFPKTFEGDLEALDLNVWLAANDYPAHERSVFPAGVPCRIVTHEGASTDLSKP